MAVSPCTLTPPLKLFLSSVSWSLMVSSPFCCGNFSVNLSKCLLTDSFPPCFLTFRLYSFVLASSVMPFLTLVNSLSPKFIMLASFRIGGRGSSGFILLLPRFSHVLNSSYLIIWWVAIYDLRKEDLQSVHVVLCFLHSLWSLFWLNVYGNCTTHCNGKLDVVPGDRAVAFPSNLDLSNVFWPSEKPRTWHWV